MLPPRCRMTYVKCAADIPTASPFESFLYAVGATFGLLDWNKFWSDVWVNSHHCDSPCIAVRTERIVEIAQVHNTFGAPTCVSVDNRPYWRDEEAGQTLVSRVGGSHIV